MTDVRRETVGQPDPGTRQWAEMMRNFIYTRAVSASYSEKLNEDLAEFARYEGWRLLCDRSGKPFESFREFCEHPRPEGLETPFTRIEKHWELAVRAAGEPLPKHGANQHTGADGTIRSTPDSYGTDPDYLARRLARDAPEELEKLQRGEHTKAARSILKRFGAGYANQLAHALLDAAKEGGNT